MSIKKLLKNQTGIGLVETILAIGIAVIVITSLVSLAVFTLRSSQQSKYLLEGSKLANQQLELVRAYRETVTWTEFFTALRSCDTADCWVSVDNSSGPPATFIVHAAAQEDLGVPAVSLVRYFRASNPDGTVLSDSSIDSIVRISVTVHWRIGGSDRYAHTYTDLTNWQGN